MRRWMLCGSALVLVFAALIASAAGPGDALKPGDAPPKKPGDAQRESYRAQLLAFNRETLSGAYTKVGRRGKWDADAVKFLDRMAEFFTDGPAGLAYKRPLGQKAMLPELVASGKALADAGCDDPLVLYCFGVALHDSGQMSEALANVRAGFDGMEKQGYPLRRAWSAAKRLARLDTSKETAERTQAVADRYELPCACGKLTDFQRRLALSDLRDLGTRPPPVKLAFLDKLAAQADVDPWVRHAVSGAIRIKLAWDSRGGGWANTVTDDGWRGFHEQLAKARDDLTAAYKLAPHLPEAAADMITVAMGAGDQLKEDGMTWFERAEKADLEYIPAYDRMFNALLPRWGGSHGAMYELGMRAAATERYDTSVPWQLVVALQKIGQDTGQGWRATLARPGVYEAVVVVVDGYARELKKQGEDDSWHRSLRAAAAWRAQRYDDARKALEKLGDRADLAAFAFFESEDPPAAVGHAYAMAGPHAEDAKRAEELFGSRKYDEALAAFKAMQSKGDLHAREVPYVKARVALADRRARLERGDWVDIQPQETLANWKIVSGAWRIDGDGQLLVETAGPYTPCIVCEESFGERVEISGVMEPLGPKGGMPGVSLAAGMYPGYHIGYMNGKLYLFGRGFKQQVPSEALAGIGGPLPFSVRYADGKFSAYVNGKPAVENHPVPPQLVQDLHVGLHVNTGGSARFSQLKVRRIIDAPKPAAAAEPPGDGLE